MFLQTESENIATLHRRLAACTYMQGGEIFEWIARLDAIFTQLKAAGKEVADAEKKTPGYGTIDKNTYVGSNVAVVGNE